MSSTKTTGGGESEKRKLVSSEVPYEIKWDGHLGIHGLKDFPKPKKIVGVEVFDRIVADLNAKGNHNMSKRVTDGVEAAKTMDIKRCDEVLVLSPTKQLWFERAICLMGADISIMERDGIYLQGISRRFTGMDYYDDFESIRELRDTLRYTGKYKFIHADFESYPLEKDSLDALCIFGVIDDPRTNPNQILLKGLKTLKSGGKLLVGFVTPNIYGPGEVKFTASSCGYTLEEIARVVYDDKYSETGVVFLLKKKP